MPSGWRMIVAASDPAARHALVESLNRLDEFVVAEVGTAAEVSVALERQQFDALILDVALPDMDGRELCRTLRYQGFSAPILVLIDLDNEADIVLALDAGANDCVTKPAQMGVFLARLRAHLRQYSESDDLGLRLQHHTFRPRLKLLIDAESGKKIQLTDKETALLKYLYRARNSFASRRRLLSAIWDYNSGVETHTVETHVWRLRQKLERDPKNPSILVTEGDGYRLCVKPGRRFAGAGGPRS